MGRDRRNKYHAWCTLCGDWIAAGAGHLVGKDSLSGRWQVVCEDCSLAASRAARAEREAAWHAAGERWRASARHDYPPPHTPRVPVCLLVLGLAPPIDREVIKTRFRELAKATHPDRGGDAARFVRISAAYREALSLAGGAS